MEIFWWILLALLLCCGFLGCFINKVPGPIAVVLASLIGITALDVDLEWGHFAIIAVLAVVSIIASKVLVKLAKKMQEYSKRATIGTTIGSIIGLILVAGASSMDSDAAVIVTAIVGLVVLPFVLAFLLELTNKNGAAMAVKCATAATCAYLADTCLKLVVFIYAVYMMFLG
jgi:uncharacterized protein YqgC (DUF456 family)